MFLILRNALTETFRKTHEKDMKQHFTGKIGDDHDKEEAKSKAEKSWMLWKQLETDRRCLYLQFDHHNLLLFESSKVTSTPQTLKTVAQDDLRTIVTSFGKYGRHQRGGSSLQSIKAQSNIP